MNNIANYTANPEVSTLLVLHHRKNSVGIVHSVSPSGNLMHIYPERGRVNNVIRIDASETSFTDFYWDFYHQLKDPSEYSFFKVKEFDAHEAAKGLQDYINDSSDFERQELIEYEVCIEAIETAMIHKCNDSESPAVNKSQNNNSFMAKNPSAYRYQIEDVPWEKMAEMGLDREKLEEIGAMEALLKGYKTIRLIPILLNDGETLSLIDARLQLRIDDTGELIVKVHRICDEADLSKRYKGYQFTKEDRINLLKSGNMGRVVGLINKVTGEIIPSLISLDRLTNELISLRLEFVRIPDVFCGVSLDLEQKDVLREGRPLYIENMLSKKGKLFSATVQFNADRQWVEFMFADKFRDSDFREMNHSDREVPSHFRGIRLRQWQMDKLEAGEIAYIKGLESKKGMTYQGYIHFDKSIDKILFSFKNQKKTGK